MKAPLDSMSSAPSDAPPDSPPQFANISRRGFLVGMSALGGLVLAVGFPGALRAEDKPKYGADGMADGWVDDPLAFVSIGEDGTVTIVVHRSEMPAWR